MQPIKSRVIEFGVFDSLENDDAKYELFNSNF